MTNTSEASGHYRLASHELVYNCYLLWRQYSRQVAEMGNKFPGTTRDHMAALGKREDLRLPKFKTESYRDCLKTLHCLTDPVAMIREVYPRCSNAEATFYVIRSIRTFCRLPPQSSVTRIFGVLCKSLQLLPVLQASITDGSFTDTDDRVLKRVNGLKAGKYSFTRLRNQLTSLCIEGSRSDQPVNNLCLEMTIVDAFLLICFISGYLRSSSKFDQISFLTESLDHEFMVGKLYGFPTSIQGLDELFGGGGMRLGYRIVAEPIPPVQARKEQITRGRSVLIRGHAGTGKTSLALSIAADVVDRGGATLYLTFEQSADQCVDTMAAIGRSEVKVARVENDSREGADLVGKITAHLKREEGVIAFIESNLGAISELAAQVIHDVTRIEDAQIKLVVVDSLSMLASREFSSRNVRHLLTQMIHDLSAMGVNVILIVESADAFADSYKHIVDTVIELTVNEYVGYSRRFIEVTKSRIQREYRGKHLYTIDPVEGFRVHISSAAVWRRLRKRRISNITRRVAFGHPSLDAILCNAVEFIDRQGDMRSLSMPDVRSLSMPDVLLVHGPKASLKTDFSFQFLVHREETKKREICGVSLYIPIRDHRDIAERRLNELKRRWDMSRENNKSSPTAGATSNIKLIELPGGFVSPGWILAFLENLIITSREAQEPVDRIVIDDLHEWANAPFLEEDPLFVTALLELFRTNSITVMFVTTSEYLGTRNGGAILDQANWVFKLSPLQLPGAASSVLSIEHGLKSGTNRRDIQVGWEGDRFVIEPMERAFHVNPEGLPREIAVRLFLHSETAAQRNYNSSIVDFLKATLVPTVHLEPDVSSRAFYSASILRHSALKELQIWQLDEFDVPIFTGYSQKSVLVGFNSGVVASKLEFSGLWSDDEDSGGGGMGSGRRSIAHDGIVKVFPYYREIGFLAVDHTVWKDEWRRPGALSWDSLVSMSRQFESDKKNDHALFFDLEWRAESLNCLFFEILSELIPPLDQFHEWMDAAQERGKLLEAAEWLNQLLYRSAQTYRRAGDPHQYGPAAFRRQWFAGLRQSSHNLNRWRGDSGRGVNARTHVTLLPGRSVSGDWFLGISLESLVPRIGLDLVGILLTEQQEYERYSRGVGLPVRNYWYKSGGVPIGGADSVPLEAAANAEQRRTGDDHEIVYEVSLDVIKRACDESIKRSSFLGYGRWRSILSDSLRQVVATKPGERRSIERILKEFVKHCDRPSDAGP